MNGLFIYLEKYSNFYSQNYFNFWTCYTWYEESVSESDLVS